MSRDTMPLAEALDRLDAMVEAKKERAAAFGREHCASLAAEMGVPVGAMTRALDRGIAAHLAYVEETRAIARADLLLMADPQAGLEAVADRWRAGGGA